MEKLSVLDELLTQPIHQKSIAQVSKKSDSLQMIVHLLPFLILMPLLIYEFDFFRS